MTATDLPDETSLSKGAGMMAAGTAVSRILGVVRNAVLVAAIGVTSPGGAFNVANWLPNQIFMLIAGGLLSAILVPAIVRAYRTGQGQDFVDRLLTLAMTALVVLTVVLTLAAPLLVRLVANNDNPAYTRLATAFAFWCIPQVFFYGVSTLLGQVLNARGSFGPYMWAPVLNNLISIAGFGVFIAVYGRFSTTGGLSDPAAWGAAPIALLGGIATIGIISQALILIVPLYRSGFRYRPRWQWRGVGLRSAGRNAGWTFAALLVGQIGIITVTNIATAADNLKTGAPGYAMYANAIMIFMLPHSLLTVSLLATSFTRLSAHAAVGDRVRMRKDTATGLRMIGVLTVFATALIAVLALPIVRLVVPVTPEQASSIATIVVTMMIGLSALGAWSMAQRVFYAHEDAKGLFWIQGSMSLVVAGGSVLAWLVLPVSWWVAGVGVATSLSYVFGAVWAGLAVRKRLGGGGRGAVVMHGKAVLAAAVAAAAGWPLVRMFGAPQNLGFLQAAVVCTVVTAVMGAVYVLLLRRMHVSELQDVAAPALSLLHRTMGRTGLVRASSGPGGGGARVDVVLGHGTLLAGRYRLDQPVATDLPGVERWLAQDQILDRPVTATVLRSGRVTQAQDGARRAALVTDPRLLRVLDVGEHEGLAYVVTERARGRTLADLTARGPLPADQARTIVGEAAVALEAARRRGVHHLALRPSVVHVSPTGVVVSGLGMDGELREHGLGDARSTTRADTVALVGLLYVALTGRRPGSPDGPWAAPMVAGTMVPPAELVPGIPNDLDTLCAVTLGPHDDGPHSPAELVLDLEPWGRVDLTGIDSAMAAHGATTTPGTEDVHDGAGAATSGEAPESGAAEMPPVPEPPAALVGAAAVLAADGLPDDGTSDDDRDGTSGPRGDDSATATDGTVPRADDAPPGDDEAIDGDEQTGVVRTSVRGSLAGIRSDRPGTPPPAFVPPVHHPDPRSTSALSVGPGGPRATASVDDAAAADAWRPQFGGAGSAPAVPLRSSSRPQPEDERARPAADPAGRAPATPPVLPPALAPRSVGSTNHPAPDHRDFDSLIGRGADVLTRKRFDPTPLVLALVAVAILVGAVMAWNSLTAPGGLFSGLGSIVDPGTSASPRPTSYDTPTPSADASGASQSPSPSSTPQDPPVIASAQMVDPPPGGDNNEHPELVDRAIDGNPATAWISRTYASPTYGMKSGIGYAVTLQKPAKVTKVTLTVNGSGGMVEVRATDPSTPTAGPVLASGPLSPTTVLTLDPAATTQTIVLWFTALPQTPDGRNRIELAEVTVS